MEKRNCSGVGQTSGLPVHGASGSVDLTASTSGPEARTTGRPEVCPTIRPEQLPPFNEAELQRDNHDNLTQFSVGMISNLGYASGKADVNWVPICPIWSRFVHYYGEGGPSLVGNWRN